MLRLVKGYELPERERPRKREMHYGKIFGDFRNVTREERQPGDFYYNAQGDLCRVPLTGDDR